jgi:hypothetical protein
MVRKWQVKTFNRMIGLQYPGLALCVVCIEMAPER